MLSSGFLIYLCIKSIILVVRVFKGITWNLCDACIDEGSSSKVFLVIYGLYYSVVLLAAPGFLTALLLF